MTDASAPAYIRPPERRRPQQRSAPIPYQNYLRDFTMPDGRRILVDKRAVAFITERKENPTAHTIIGFKSGSAGVPVVAAFDVVRAWWKADPASGPRPAPPVEYRNGNRGR